MQPMMSAHGEGLGLSWFDVQGAVNHAIHLLETQGDTAIALVKTIMAGIQAVTSRNLIGIFTTLNDGQAQVSAIVAAIKAEFGGN